MSKRISISHILYYNTLIGSIFCGIVSIAFLVFIILILAGVLPQFFQASYEVPVRLINLEEFYPLHDLGQEFEITHIEIKNSKLEVLPIHNTFFQSLTYIIAFVYVSIIGLILYFLSQVLKRFSENLPFSVINSKYLKWIGFMAIGLAIYELIAEWGVSQYFANKIDLSNLKIIEDFNIWNMNWLAIFLGFILLSLSTVFKTGTHLQELEELTV